MRSNQNLKTNKADRTTNPVRNETGGAIAAYKGVKISGDSTLYDIPKVILIAAVTDKCLGITTANFANNSNMDVLVKGRLVNSGLDTQLATVGDFVYLTATGDLSLVPSMLLIGYVETLAASGTVYIDIHSKNKEIPFVTTIQRLAMVAPPNGMMVFDTTLLSYFYYNAGWVQFSSMTGLGDLGTQLNNFVLPATANTSFVSNANNNPYTFYFDDGLARQGVRRYHFLGLTEIKCGENMPAYDTAGLKGWHPIDHNGKTILNMGFYGNWTTTFDENGFFITSTVSGAYFICSDIFSKLNLITIFDATAEVSSIYIDNVDTGDNLTITGSTVLNSKYYATHQLANVPLGGGGVVGVVEGIHTFKLIRDDTNASYFYGIELINEATASDQEITVPACSHFIKGSIINFNACIGADKLPYKGTVANGGQTIVGTKGGFVGYVADETGEYISYVQEPTIEEQAGVIEDNGAGSDTIDGLTDSSEFYANAQGNLVRIKDATNTDRTLLVPTAAPDANTLTFANDFDNVADTTLFAGNKQFQDDGATGSTFADEEAVTVELYAKIGANADHTDEECYTVKKWDENKNKIVDVGRTLHFADFGNQRSDDFSMLYISGSNDAAFTLSDNSSILIAEDSYAATNLCTTGANDFISLCFFGTGLDIELTSTQVIKKIFSDAPLGSHTVKLLDDGANWEVWIDGVYCFEFARDLIANFYCYRPKKPVLTDNYEYAFYNYVVADFVITNLPISKDIIDQGVIRKSNVREFAYVGTWTYDSINTATFLSGRGIYTATDANSISFPIFMSGHFRTWIYFSNGGDDEYVNVDGADQQTNNPAGATLGGYIYNTSNPAEGLHKINRIAHRTAGTLYFDAIDFHTPTYNQFYNLANPYPDYLYGQNGTLDNRKLTIIDRKPKPRILKAFSTVANNTSVISGGNFICSLCVDAGNYEFMSSGRMTKNAAATDNAALSLYFLVDNVSVRITSFAQYIGNGEINFSNNYKHTLSKRQRIVVQCAATNNKYVYKDEIIKESQRLVIEEK